MNIKTIEYKKDSLRIIDQRRLPDKLIYKNIKNTDEACKAIKTLTVRGAPAIGVFAAFGLYIGIKNLRPKTKKDFLKKMRKVLARIRTTRPTAINLFWAIGRMERLVVNNIDKPVKEIKDLLFEEAKRIKKEDEDICRAMGRNGARLVKSGDTILTHCNAGALATAGSGTALAVIYEAKRQGKRIKVYVDETRPLLQGARLTTWELMREGIDVTLICDNMAAYLMKQKKIDKIFVGADRIVKNGDFANKVGTYNLAVCAKEHKIPFYVVAPSSSFDFSLSKGDEIPIEQRNKDEVKKIKGKLIAPSNVKVYNPAFDVTPAKYVFAIITETGIFRRPYTRSLETLKK